MPNPLRSSTYFPEPPTRAPGSPALTLRKRQAFGLLERIGQELAPTPTQAERAETSYQAVGTWLSEDPLLSNALIYAQGSVAHGTANKPIGRNEHDVDLICRTPGYTPELLPAILKKIVGDRLRSHDRYCGMLEEMPRCWRLNYAGEFHLDITPSIPNPCCSNGGELVPDRTLKAWKASNPKGFRDLFARRAALKPVKRSVADGPTARKAEIEPFPAKSSIKGVLRVTVQLLKRDRDIDFLDQEPALAPLSIILTTLASRGYEWCVNNQPYDNELDLVCDMIRVMPWFIDTTVTNGQKQWIIPNETTAGENFAEKWNSDPRRVKSFFEGP